MSQETMRICFTRLLLIAEAPRSARPRAHPDGLRLAGEHRGGHATRARDPNGMDGHEAF
jgi:hypothetical protein